MKKFTKIALWALAIVLLIAVLVVVNLPEKTAPTGTEVGETLPDFEITCLDGSTFRLSEHRGKTVVINLWATWCAPCVEELPNFDRLLRERPTEVAVLAVHSPPVTADVPAFLAEHSYALPFAVDESGEVSSLLGASAVLPQTIILDADGVVRTSRTGAMDYELLETLVNAARR